MSIMTAAMVVLRRRTGEFALQVPPVALVV
jgi:hypothetical protein